MQPFHHSKTSVTLSPTDMLGSAYIGQCRLTGSAWLLLRKTAWVLTPSPLMWVAIFPIFMKQRSHENFMSVSSLPLCEKIAVIWSVGWKTICEHIHTPLSLCLCLRLCSSWLIICPVRWPHLGQVIILRLNFEPLGEPGVSPLQRGRCAFSVFLGSPGKPGRNCAWVGEPRERWGTVSKTCVHWF